jgi:hypothetical protein
MDLFEPGLLPGCQMRVISRLPLREVSDFVATQNVWHVLATSLKSGGGNGLERTPHPITVRQSRRIERFRGGANTFSAMRHEMRSSHCAWCPRVGRPTGFAELR